jgi:antitoxin (DNA-binding transcriptional repressor) of toxin-antitoxin stability system
MSAHAISKKNLETLEDSCGTKSRIDADEANNRSRQRLRRIVVGQQHTIIPRGRPVAGLVPVRATPAHEAGEAARRMRALMQQHPPRRSR